ncbi:YbaY family lipoprotein [Imbroritus primus]|uniref:YbaY family lipoprotein n=1 Tax=Imbroritus primus TaxID=3058603 RepID=UPI003D161377
MKAKAIASAAVASVVLAGAAQAGVLTGTATYRERIALPPDATFEVMLQDVSLADAPAKVLGRSILDPAGQPPFHFGIAYQDRAIVPNHRYAVRAVVRHRGKLLFTTDTYVPAFEQGSKVAIQMVHVADPGEQGASTVADSPLRGTYWKLMQVNQAAVKASGDLREPHLLFSTTEARLSGHGGCNGIGGSFDADSSTLRFKNMVGTMMACENMAQESAFLQALETVRRYRITGGQLELLNEGGAVVARLQAVAPR